MLCCKASADQSRVADRQNLSSHGFVFALDVVLASLLLHSERMKVTYLAEPLCDAFAPSISGAHEEDLLVCLYESK